MLSQLEIDAIVTRTGKEQLASILGGGQFIWNVLCYRDHPMNDLLPPEIYLPKARMKTVLLQRNKMSATQALGADKAPVIWVDTPGRDLNHHLMLFCKAKGAYPLKGSVFKLHRAVKSVDLREFMVRSLIEEARFKTYADVHGMISVGLGILDEKELPREIFKADFAKCLATYFFNQIANPVEARVSPEDVDDIDYEAVEASADFEEDRRRQQPPRNRRREKELNAKLKDIRDQEIKLEEERTRLEAESCEAGASFETKMRISMIENEKDELVRQRREAVERSQQDLMREEDEGNDLFFRRRDDDPPPPPPPILQRDRRRSRDRRDHRSRDRYDAYPLPDRRYEDEIPRRLDNHFRRSPSPLALAVERLVYGGGGAPLVDGGGGYGGRDYGDSHREERSRNRRELSPLTTVYDRRGNEVPQRRPSDRRSREDRFDGRHSRDRRDVRERSPLTVSKDRRGNREVTTNGGRSERRRSLERSRDRGYDRGNSDRGYDRGNNDRDYDRRDDRRDSRREDRGQRSDSAGGRRNVYERLGPVPLDDEPVNDRYRRGFEDYHNRGSVRNRLGIRGRSRETREMREPSPWEDEGPPASPIPYDGRPESPEPLHKDESVIRDNNVGANGH